MAKVTFSLEAVEDADVNQEGFCISCGFCQGGCEPDAREYTCEDCGENTVYGAQKILLMGLVK